VYPFDFSPVFRFLVPAGTGLPIAVLYYLCIGCQGFWVS
jgi:hypothetical protein